MERIINVDEILLGYLKAFFGLKDLIREKAKGDWNKLALLVENDENARQLDEQMSYYENQFREDTALVNLYTSSKGRMKAILDLLREEQESERAPKTSIAWDLEAARDMIADLTHEDDERVVALDNLARLPNYSPDDWVRRKYQFHGIYMPPKANIPPWLIRLIKEANYSFVYGNFLAAAALARAILEYSLKERFPELIGLKLSTISKNGWSKIKGLREHGEMQELADKIRKRGNYIMHSHDKDMNPKKRSLAYIFNEMTTGQILIDLKSLLEFLYA